MSTFTGPAFYTEADKFQKVEFEDIAKNKAKAPGKADNGWVAMVQHYFVAAWLPADGPTRQFYARNSARSDLFAAGVICRWQPSRRVRPARSMVPLYAGPQEQEKLAKIAPRLRPGR